MRGEHRSQHELIRAPVDQPVELQDLRVGVARDQALEVVLGLDRQSAERAGERLPVGRQNDEKIGIDARALVLDRGQQCRSVSGRYRLPEAEIRGEDLHRAREPAAAKFQRLTRRICCGAQLNAHLPFDLGAPLDGDRGDHGRQDQGHQSEHQYQDSAAKTA